MNDTYVLGQVLFASVIITIIFIYFLTKDIVKMVPMKRKIEEPADVFDDELGLIKDDILRQFIKYCLTKAPKELFTIPASSTGKYHPSYALGDGGLVRHIKAAVKIAKRLLNLEMYKDLDQDLIYSALILNDAVKAGFEQKEGEKITTVLNHPVLATELIKECYNNSFFKSEIKKDQIENICRLILSHMGKWNTYKNGVVIMPKPVKEDEKFVHLCDYLAATKFLEVKFEEE